MKYGKKLMALICALALTVGAVAGCGKDDATDANGEKVGKEKVTANPEKAVEGYFDSFLALDFESVKKYVAEEAHGEIDAIETQLAEQFSSMDEMVESLGLEEAQAEVIYDKIGEMMVTMLSLIDYAIVDSEVDGDSAVVTVDVGAPDFESIDTSSLVDESLFMDFLTESNVDIMSIDSMSEDEMNKFTVDMMLYMLDAMEEKFTDPNRFEITAERIEIPLTLVDGEWLLNAGLDIMNR